MRITLYSYGPMVEFLGREKEIEVADETSVKDLAETLAQKYPLSAILIKSCRFAIDDEFVETGSILSPNLKISVFPPFSGG